LTPQLEDEQLCYARWSGDGDRLFALTTKGRVLALAARDGSVLSVRDLPIEGSRTNQLVLAGAINGSGSLTAYSVTRFASSLYLATGLRE
jgi:hypothetical protein